MKHFSAFTALIAILNGCVVGPDYRPPLPPHADGWIEPASVDTADGPQIGRWWQQFDDPLLDAWVERALADNRGLHVAQARLREARALRRVSASSLGPRLSANASYTRYELSKNAAGFTGDAVDAGLASRDDDFYDAGFDASWELDLFGGNRRRLEAASARQGAAEAAVDGVRLSLVAEVTRVYIEMRGLEARLAVAGRNVAIQTATLDLVTRKAKTGLSPPLDALRAEAQLEATRATIPALETHVRAAAYALAVLAGATPDEAAARPTTTGIPAARGDIAVGLRSEMLRRRPDVRAAERTLAAANADIGAAVAARFPSFSLNAALGLEAGRFDDLVDGDSRRSSLVPGLKLPLFTAGALQAGVDAASARYDAELAAYEQTVLAALGETESAMAALGRAGATRNHARVAAAASTEAAAIARRLYEGGLGDFLSVLDAETRALEAEDALARSETASALTVVALYKSLGVL